MSAAETERDGINLLDLLLILARRKRLLLVLPFVFGVLGVIYAVTAKPIFEAKALMMPPQQQQSSAGAMLAQLGGLGGLGGFGGALGLKNPADLYVGMLTSETVVSRLADRFKLRDVYSIESRALTIKKLRASSEIAARKDGLISITVADTSPKLAAALANGYIEELRGMTQGLAVTEAQQRRLFYENQLQTAKNQLGDAEIALKAMQQKTGILDVEAQAQMTITALAQLKAQIGFKEVELAGLRSYATTQNPDYLRVQNELSGLRAQLNALTRGQEDEVMIIKSKAPELSLDYIRTLRDVKYRETLFEIVAKQYEIARLDEAKEGAVIQVIDRALPPERKSRPKKTMVVIGAVVAGLFVAILLAFVLEALQRAKSGPDADKLRELRAALGWRRRTG